MNLRDNLKIFKGLVDEAIKEDLLQRNQSKAADILSEASKHLTRKEFKELEKYVFEKLEK